MKDMPPTEYSATFFGALDLRENDMITVYEGKIHESNIIAKRLFNETQGTTNVAGAEPGVGWRWPKIVAPIRGYVKEVVRKTGASTFTLVKGAPFTGFLETNGTEQPVHDGSLMRNVSGYIDLSAMEAGDKVIVRQYIQVAEGGPYVNYASEEYVGPQDSPVLYITPKRFGFGGRITFNQSVGFPKQFPYQFIEE